MADIDSSMKSKYISPKTADKAVFVNTAEFMPIVEDRLRAGHSVVIAVRGKSMRPLLREGRDSVVLSPIVGEVKKFDILMYKRADGSYTIHRVVGVSNNGFTIVGDNQFVYENDVPKSSVIAVVSAIKRRGRTIDIGRPILRLYAKIWQSTRGARYLPIRVLRKLKSQMKKK